MKVKELKHLLSKMPDNFDVTVRDYTSNIWSNVEIVTMKNSVDRVYINFTHGK